MRRCEAPQPFLLLPRMPILRSWDAFVFRRLGTRLANHRASLSSELGSLWDFLRADKPDRRRSEPADASTYEPIHPDSRTPSKLARDLLQVVQDTIFAKKLTEKPKMCPLVKEESDLTSSEDDRDEKFNTDTRIAHLIDFFFTIVKSQRPEDQRKGSGGSCFRSETSPSDETLEVYTPKKINTELEKKMDTLMEFLATTGCMEKEEEKDTKGEKKITLMEFLFGPESKKIETKPAIEINRTDTHIEFKKCLSLSESNISVKDISFIDETPGEEGRETLVEILLKYMENYDSDPKFIEPTKSISLTPSLSEKSKSDVTISRLETLSDISKTKSDSSLTRTQDTVIDKYDDMKSDKSAGSRRISETVVDLSYIKQDVEEIIIEAVKKISEENDVSMENYDDVMSEQEDAENFNTYTQPLPYIQYLPYSVELSDILEEDEPSSNQLEKNRKQEVENAIQIDVTSEDPEAEARIIAEYLLNEMEERIQDYPFKNLSSSSGPSTEEFSREMELSPSSKRSSISLIDLRNIPDLPPSLISKPKVKKIDKSTSTTEISDSNSDISRRRDSGCMTEDTTLTSSSEISERALDKLESLHKFFSKSRLEIIDESLEDNGEKKEVMDTETSISGERQPEYKAGQASLDDVEDIQEDAENGKDKSTETKEEDRGVVV
ncbi:hypothetical protein EVAR_53457_1 [Eumeta japonica]|uniref:Uncharacterized protein n=1 Tax=Eumeta variegata TaxID=151549 RepID=A0A4C1XQ74_EUMVA|nr:hypothetical protein EVAR_53457_1 [Eumeta japonica]